MTASVLPRGVFAGLLMLCAVVTPAWALDRGQPPPQALGTGPNFSVLRTPDYAGRILVVTFWASWCGPCLHEMSVLERLQQEAGDQLAVVSVNIESLARFREVRRVLSKRLSLTLAHDGDGSVRKAWGVGPIPHMFMIDHEGRVAYEHRGYGNDFIPSLVDEVNELLRRQAHPDPASTP